MNNFAIIRHEFSGKGKGIALLLISAVLYTLPFKSFPAYLCLGGLGSYVALLLMFIHKRPFSSPANIYRILPIAKADIYFQSLIPPFLIMGVSHLLLFLLSVTEPLSFAMLFSALCCTLFTYFCARCCFWVYHYNTAAFFSTALISGLIIFFSFNYSEPLLISGFALLLMLGINIKQECF